MVGLKGSKKLYFSSLGKDCTLRSNCYCLIFHKQFNSKPWMGGEKCFKEKGALHTSFSKIRIQSLHSHCCHIYYFIIWLWIQVYLIEGSYTDSCLYIDSKLRTFFLKARGKLMNCLNDHLHLDTWASHRNEILDTDIGLYTTFWDRFPPTSPN